MIRHSLLGLAFTLAGTSHGLSAIGDFDGDGQDEVLLRRTSGELTYYDLDGEQATGNDLPIVAADSVRLLAIGDFDGDGTDEVLARDRGDHRWRYFDVTDEGVVELLVPAMTRNAAWSVATVGDFNGDGTDDVMIRRKDTGLAAYYAMDGTAARLVRNSVTRNTRFQVMGTGDFNGDGHDDILLRDADNGRWIHYDMARPRGTLRRPALTPNQRFEFQAIGDLNGDGRDDVLLRHAGTGEWIYYAMATNHRGRLTRRFGLPSDLPHEAIATGDFNGNGSASPLFRHPDNGGWMSYDLTTSPVRSDIQGMTTDLTWVLAFGSRFERPCISNDCAAALLRGVNETALRLPGALCVYGPQAFPVVTGMVTDTVLGPVVAGAHWDPGRTVVFGAELHRQTFGQASADTARLVTNALRWTSRAAAPRIGVLRHEELLTRLKGAGHDAVSSTPSQAALSAVDVVALDMHPALSQSELDALAAFLRAGGGMVAFGGYWGSSSRLRGNQLLGQAGIAWAGVPINLTSARGFTTQRPPDPLTHGTTALEATEAHRAGERSLTDAQRVQATETLACIARWVSPDDQLIWPKVLALVRGNERWPTAAAPLVATDTVERLATVILVEGQRDLAAESVRAHPAAADFPGAVPADAPRLTRSVTVDADGPQQNAHPGARWHSTGLYAAPGELVTVSLPEAAGMAGLHVRIGGHSADITIRPDWKRVPQISRRFPVLSSTTLVANAFGGLIYLEVPPGTGLGRIAVEISGAVAAPRFVLGETDDEAWRNEIRHAPGPWAEIEGLDMIVTTQASDVRNLDDPGAVAAAWDRMVELTRELVSRPAGMSGPERFVVDRQTRRGYMLAGYPITAHLNLAGHVVDAEYLSTCRQEATLGSWGMRHELGHNFQLQNRDWTFEGTLEVTVNLFTLYVYEFQCGVTLAENRTSHTPVQHSRETRMERYDFRNPDFEQWKDDPALALVMYEQMQLAFGWEAYRAVFATYEALPDAERPKNDDEKRDQWLVRFSREVGHNLGPFFEAWGIPTSREARDSIAGLPTWMPDDFPPNR